MPGDPIPDVQQGIVECDRQANQGQAHGRRYPAAGLVKGMAGGQEL